MNNIVTRVEKPWGYELHWAKTQRYVGKILHINAGHALSLQYHKKKEETIYLYSGRLLYEIDVDGSECELGKVAVWEPPSRLVLIWQLTPEFAYNPNLITEVEVLFTPEGDGTRVDLEHRDLERMGEKAETMAEAVGGPGGWPAILQLFAEEAGKSNQGDRA